MQQISINIGRKQENDVVLTDEFVSGFHAILQVCAGGTYLLSDAGSSNGTFIMRHGQTVRILGPERVWPNEELVLGNCRMTVSQLLSLAPPHLAFPPALNNGGEYNQDRTRPLYLPPNNNPRNTVFSPPVLQQGGMPVTPGQIAVDRQNLQRQQGVPRIPMGSPVPSQEQVIWEGYSSLAFWMKGIIWSGLCLIIWLFVALNSAIFASLIANSSDATGDLSGPFTLLFIIFAISAMIGLIRKILSYLNIYYVFSTQRVRRREGILSLRHNQIELFRLKDFEVLETLWGRLFNYCHIRLVSSERIMSNAILIAVPNGARLAEEMRELAQINRAESGIMFLRE